LLERLPEDERALLVDEILHRREADLPGRIRQMGELGIFDIVVGEVEKELAHAEAELAPHSELAPVVLLRQLCETLRNQVAALRSSDNV